MLWRLGPSSFVGSVAAGAVAMGLRLRDRDGSMVPVSVGLWPLWWRRPIAVVRASGRRVRLRGLAGATAAAAEPADGGECCDACSTHQNCRDRARQRGRRLRDRGHACCLDKEGAHGAAEWRGGGGGGGSVTWDRELRRSSQGAAQRATDGANRRAPRCLHRARRALRARCGRLLESGTAEGWTPFWSASRKSAHSDNISAASRALQPYQRKHIASRTCCAGAARHASAPRRFRS